MPVISPKECTVYGTGDAKSLCLLMEVCGIGDNIHALPTVVALIEQGYDITIFCRSFVVPFWERTGAKVYAVKRDAQAQGTYVNDKGEVESFGVGFYENNLPKFGRIVSLTAWSCWDTDEKGFSVVGMLPYFAELLGAELPESFDYVEFLGAKKEQVNPYVLFSPESTETWRTLPKTEAWALYNQLNKEHPTRWLETTQCETWGELVSVVYSAEVVVSVENGILNLASALGKPVVGLHGATEPTHTVETLRKYIDFPALHVMGNPPEGCQYPCYRRADRGLSWYKSPTISEQRCVGKYHEPQCLKNISRDAVVSGVNGLLHSGEANSL